jgi:hypothetical protein
MEVGAAIIAVAAALSPYIQASAALAVVGVILKCFAKHFQARSRGLFRSGERARRYSFYSRSLGWPPPPSTRADIAGSYADARLIESVARLSVYEDDYYSRKGPPGDDRFFSNLCESAFWTNKLMKEMTAIRKRQFLLAGAAVLITLVALALIQPGDPSFVVIKALSAMVVLVIAIDIYGDFSSFARGERETDKLVDAIASEMRCAPLRRDEGIRLMGEYNCLLAEMPLIPDDVYLKHQDRLNAAWSVYESALTGNAIR